MSEPATRQPVHALVSNPSALENPPCGVVHTFKKNTRGRATQKQITARAHVAQSNPYTYICSVLLFPPMFRLAVAVAPPVSFAPPRVPLPLPLLLAARHPR